MARRALVPLALGLALGAGAARAQPPDPVPAAAAAEAPMPPEIDSATFGGLEARALGPAVMGGRIAAIDAVANDPVTVWVGAASGGVWKSVDGGVSFEPVFDDHAQSIGAVRVDPSDPKTVWVGTGESCTRNSVSVGDGVYKTTDGGETWQRMGLESSERIAGIAVHPKDGKTVWVCATGHLWDDHDERGVYKTTDGGKSWKRVLAVDGRTGCSDLSLDPQDPRVLYAGMWQFRRTPWSFHSGGKGSALYQSRDGGETWKKLDNGLPKGEKGRIAVAVAPSRPSVVYAVVESERTALFRSDDTGHTWEEVNSSFNIQARPFYFAHVVVDPTDFDYVYKPGLTLTISTDGGRSFNSPFSGHGFGGVHPDHHALWINPKNPHEMFLGTDGGLYVSHDRAHRWRFAKVLPVSQFYEVSYDDEWPYNVYGGLQDNGTWTGPSRSPGGIENKDWKDLFFGDGFHVFRDAADPDYVYVEYQGGNIGRVNLETGEARDIKPQPRKGERELRFNWNTPIHLSPTQKGTVYLGSQFLFRSRDRGDSWERASPDLTTNDPAKQKQRESGGLTRDNSTAENHTTIYTIAESPKDPQTIWAGTDDGRLQVTRDGGKSWTDTAPALPGLPRGTWVSHVEASAHDAATAYATFDGHARGDMETYVFKTTDSGKSWTSLGSDALSGYAHVVEEDPANRDLLFLGTEDGLFVSVDGGARWARFTGNFPQRVAVRDLVVHPRESDLIVATHGRGIYILDDITPLRQLTRETLDSEVAILSSRPSVAMIPSAGQSFGADDEFVAFNPSEQATIVYYLKKRHLFGDLKVEVYDEAGKRVATLPGGKRKGLNRVAWPMRAKPPKMPPANSLVMNQYAMLGPRVPLGTYTVKVVKGDQTYPGTVELVADPRSRHAAEDRAAQEKLVWRLYGMLERLTYLADAVADAEAQAQKRGLKALAASLAGLRKELVATSEGGWLSGEEQLREKIGLLYGSVNSYEGRPTQSQVELAGVLEERLEEAERRAEALREKNAKALSWMSREEWEKKQAGS
ncbi:MAG TPA: glycosyl hydrolase [Thermoanaerobaculia bacterium]|nr:glycosyl hydrolase [Thermoanaerobaculia bacterium]